MNSLRSRAPLVAFCTLLPFAACAPAVPANGPSSPLLATGAPPAFGPAGTADVATALSNYSKPPQALLEVLHAPSPPQLLVSPTGDAMLLVSWVEYPSIQRVSEPFLKLAGVRLEPRTRRRHDTPGGYAINGCVREMALMPLEGGAPRTLALPRDQCAERPIWAADGKHFVFRSASASAVELWVGDAKTATAKRIPGVQLNPMFGYSLQWLPDQVHVLVKLVPDGQGAPPAFAAAPIAPSIQETGGEKGESSTYEARDTLTSKHEENLFEYYATSQLAAVDINDGSKLNIGAPGLYREVDIAPYGWSVSPVAKKRSGSVLLTG